jgi:thiol-disulfide isomerase/thioredoxin
MQRRLRNSTASALRPGIRRRSLFTGSALPTSGGALIRLTKLGPDSSTRAEQRPTITEASFIRVPRRRILCCAAMQFGLFSILGTSAAMPSAVRAHGRQHSADLRNASNQFAHLRPLRRAPSLPMLAPGRRVVNLDRYRGQWVLLNFWATWCPPCIEELPALDRLRDVVGSDALAVVALSIDEGDVGRPVSFVRRLGLSDLDVYRQLATQGKDAFPLYGLPVTYLIAPDGLVLGYIVGAVKWDSADAVAFLQHYLEVGAGEG